MLIEEASYNYSAIVQALGELAVRLEAQDIAFEVMQRKHQEELEAVKKSQQKKNEAWEKKQHDIDNLIGFLLRAQATQQESIVLSIVVSNLSRCYFYCHFCLEDDLA
ncbi:hypothetical protein VPH35_026958 [Triticum aestivum]